MRLPFRTNVVLWAAIAAGLFVVLGFVGKRDSLWHDLLQQAGRGPSGGQNQILLRIAIRMPLFGLAAVATGWVIQAAVGACGVRLSGRCPAGPAIDFDDKPTSPPIDPSVIASSAA